MKKILSFIVAILCAGLLPAQTYLADGAIIQIGANYMEENILRPGDLKGFNNGCISYDPENHVLTLVNVTIELSSSTTPALTISTAKMAEGQKHIEVRLMRSNAICNNESNDDAVALQTIGDVTFTGIDGLLFLGAAKGICWTISAGSSATIKDGAIIRATKDYSYSPRICVFNWGEINVDCATLEMGEATYGTCLSVSEIQYKDAKMAGSYSKYSVSKQCYVDASNNMLNDAFSYKPTKNLFYMDSDDPAGGKAEAKRDGKVLPNPYRYADSEAGTIDIVASVNEGWKFHRWTEVGATNYITDTYQKETTLALPESSIQSTLIVHTQYMYNTPSAFTKPWYYIGNMTDKIYKYSEKFEGSEKLVELSKSGVSKTEITHSVYADGRLYFIDKIDFTHSRMQSALFDPATGAISDQKDVFASQTEYQQFDGLAYHATDECFYAIARKSDKNQQYLLTIDPKTGIKSAKELMNLSSKTGCSVQTMAVDKNGDIYALLRTGMGMNYAYTNRCGTLLCKINPSSTDVVKIGFLDIFVNVSSVAMAFDYKTNELLVYAHDSWATGFYSVDVKKCEAKHLTNDATYCNGLFQITPKPSLVELKVNDSEMGTAVILDGGKDKGRFMPGAEVDIEAMANSTDYRFIKWSDGETKNPRTITVGEKDVTYTAEFGWAEGITPYSIWVYGKQILSTRLSFTKTEIAKITAGSITYNPSTNTLELNGLTMSSSDDKALIRIGEEGKSTKMTIKVVNADSKLTGTLSTVPLRLYNADVTVKGDMKLTLDGAGCGVFLGKGSKLTLEGVTATIKGSYAINGDETSANEKLMIKGSTVSLDGVTKAAYELNSAEWNYCTPYPLNAYFEKEKKNFTQGEGGSELVDVSFTAAKHVKGVAVQDGTGTFQIRLRDGGGETFTDIGWFESGKELTMIAKPASGFVFGRWTDDPNWSDTDHRDLWLKATREDITMGALDITKQALFYKQPAAGATWYCVSNTTNNFTQFASRNYGDKAVDTDKTDGSLIEAGDCNGSYYYIAEGGEIKRFSFSGVSKDKEVAGYSKAVVRATYTGTITDMAYNYSDNKLYAVIPGDQKLYRVNEATDKQCLDEIGTFVTGDPETKVTITCIAIDGGGKKYVLSNSNILYTVEKEDTKEKKVKLKVVGEEGGNVGGPTVGSNSQSLAFDHVNGELFWGAKDYLRIIDLKTAKSYIAGDLGLTGGNQGYLKALHRKDRKLSLGVQVAAECAEMGTASIATEGQTELTTFAGTSVTITAKENEGYKFVRWQELLDEYADRDPEIVTENPYIFSASSSITYVAYFESAEQGIESIQHSAFSAQKVLEEGNLYIIRDGKVYNVTGNRVK